MNNHKPRIRPKILKKETGKNIKYRKPFSQVRYRLRERILIDHIYLNHTPDSINTVWRLMEYILDEYFKLHPTHKLDEETIEYIISQHPEELPVKSLRGAYVKINNQQKDKKQRELIRKDLEKLAQKEGEDDSSPSAK